MKFADIEKVSIRFIRLSTNTRGEWSDDLTGEPYAWYHKLKECWVNLMVHDLGRR